MIGWIKLYRQIEENEFYFSEKFTKIMAWIDLLILAGHKTSTVFIRGVKIDLLPGQLCWSQKSLASRWKWNRATVNKFLTLLEKEEMISNKINKVTTIITILKWEIYQENKQQTIQQSKQQNKHKQECKEKSIEKYFQDSDVFSYDIFFEKWNLSEVLKRYDCKHYYKLICDWGVNNKRKDWIAVARTFVNRDGIKAKLKPETERSPEILKLILERGY